MKWFFEDNEAKKRDDEIARSQLAIEQFTPYWSDYKRVFSTHNNIDSEKDKIGLYLFLMGALDHAMSLFQVRYEIFLDRVYEQFFAEGLEEIITEIFIEFHINRECSISAEKAYLEGRNQYAMWNQLSDKTIYDWKDGFIKNYLQESDFPTNIQSFYVMVNKTDVKAEYMNLRMVKSEEDTEFKLPENSYYDDIIDL